MHRPGRPDGLNLNTRDVEAPSPVNLNRSSMSPSFSMMTLPSVNPEPAYIAPAAAATIAVAELGSEFGVQVYDDRGNTLDVATVLPNSLALVNSFLDRLLFNFLSCAKSTSLASLRPAIVEVLKPRLAKEAIAGADEELQEYLGGDDDELNAFHNGHDAPMDWDLELVWRRARLRCMVYTRLGDMEEEDEDMYITQERLDDDDATRRISREYGIVSPAVAIFLTSILEFVGEHALIVATHASFKRLENRLAREMAAGQSQPTTLPRLMVEEGDVEKIALNANMGRLWRSWRKGVRSPKGSISGRPFRSLSIGSHSRQSSVAGVSDMQGTVPSVAEVLEPDPTTIPLPMSEHDIDEIEVPGYSAARSMLGQSRARPASVLLVRDFLPFQRQAAAQETGLETIEDAPDESEEAEVPIATRMRSQSLPTQKTPYEVTSDADSFKTPDEERSEGDEERSASESGAETPQLLPQKPHSEPSTPYHSMLDVLSRNVALQRSPPPELEDEIYGHDGTDEVDPAPDTLQFNSNDYVINEHERAEMDSSGHHGMPGPDASEAAFVSMRESPPPVRTHFEEESQLSQLSPDAVDEGDVSPMEQMSTQSGEVSPIEPSDDEDSGTRLSRKPSRDLYNEPVSPLIEHHPVPKVPAAAAAAMAATAVAATAAAVAVVAPAPEPVAAPEPVPVPVDILPPAPPPKSPRKEEVRSEVPEPLQPGQTTASRQRRTEARTGEEVAKDGKREAFMVGAVPQMPATAQANSGPLPVPPKDQVVESFAAKRPRNTSPQVTSAPKPAAAPEPVEVPTGYSDEPEPEPTHISRRKPPPGVTIPAQGTRQTTRQRPQPPVTPTAGVEKAAVQRVSGSPSSARDSAVSSTRTVEAEWQNSRGQLKSGGKARARITSAGDNLRESVTSKMSNEGKGSSEDRYSRTSVGKGAASGTDFDSLIASEETIQYTLTPQNMRNIEERKSYVASPTSVKSPPPRGDSAAHAAQTRLPQASVAPPVTSLARVAPRTDGPTPRRGLSVVPREARVSTQNTKDFADFIRSTGPDNAAGGGADRLPVISTRSSEIAKQQGRIRTSKAGPRLQAREPKVRRSENEDLINFLREGPPSDRAAIPPPRARFDQTSVASTQDSFVAKSFQSSTNSRTGLLESNRVNAKVAPAVGKRPTQAEEGMPQRKQRRVRDPYAIDTDSEEEDEDMASTPKARGGGGGGGEESLAEFLASVPPPSGRNSPPPLNLSKQTIQAVQRKSSNAGRSALPTAGAIGSRIASAANNRLGSIVSGGGGGDKTAADDDVSPAPRFSRPKPQFQARDERRGGGGGGESSVRDLADFFKNSGPPPSMQEQYSPPPPKDESGLSKILNRRKKNTGYT